MGSYKFTDEIDKQIKLFCHRQFTTPTALFESFGSSYNTYYAIKKRWVMSVNTAKKLKDAGVPLVAEE